MSSNINSSSGSNNHTDTEVEHSSVKTEMNVEFVEQQPQVIEDARLGHSIPALPPSLEAQMPDENWMAARQLSKPVVIRHFDWNLDSAPGAELNSFRFPQVITENDTIHQETLRMYSFYKFNWVLRFQINGTKFHSGQLIASWDPFGQAQDVTNLYRPFSVVYATGLPNVILNASSNEPVEITIPYVHPRNFLTTNSSNGSDLLGTIRVNVLNPLRAADGSSQKLSVTVWLYADSPSVHVPIYRHDILIPEIAEASMDFVKSLVGDDVSNLLGDASSTFGNLMTGNFGGAIKSGGSSLTGLAKVLGLDYPTRIAIPQSHINPLGPMSPGKGVDSSYRLGLDPRGGQMITQDRTGSTMDECDLDFILKTPMLFRQVIWTDANTVGTELTRIIVSPQQCAQITPQTDVVAAAPTYLGWFAQAFAFWRGGLTYKIEFVSTQFHTGRLLVALVPNETSADSTLTLQQAYSCPNVVIDLQQNSTVTLNVPFVSSTLWKSTNLAPLVAIADEAFIGALHIFVLNPLVRPSNVADTIEFNIYVYAADDFKFAVPKPNVSNIRYTVPATELAERSIGSARLTTRTAGQNDPPDISFSFGNPLLPSCDTFGEQFSLVDYMKRYGANSAETTTGSVYRFFSNRPLSLFDVDGGREVTDAPGVVTQLTPLTTVTSVFACWFGSLRYKIATNATRSDPGVLLVTHSPINENSFAGDISGGGKAIQRTNLAQNNSLDVELPCYTPYNLLITHPLRDAAINPYSDAGIFRFSIASRPADSTPLQLTVYQAAGDDFRPFYLISPPADFNPQARYLLQPLRTA